MTEQLTINLGTEIIYVYGTVNGAEATFTLVQTGVWETTVTKALDGKYVIIVTAYDAASNETTYTTTLYKLDSLIQVKFDWTINDYYYASDLVRVEANIQYLYDILVGLEYNPVVTTFITNWTEYGLPTIGNLNRVENNLEALKNAFYAPEGWLPKVIWNEDIPFSFVDANRYEYNLYILSKILDSIRNAFVYAGTFNAGQEVLL